MKLKLALFVFEMCGFLNIIIISHEFVLSFLCMENSICIHVTRRSNEVKWLCIGTVLQHFGLFCGACYLY